MREADPFSRAWRAAAIAVSLVLFGRAELPRSAFAETVGPPPGYARVWIYRDDEPYETLATPYVRMNGAVVGVSEPGGAFYRDVAPGTYRITVDSDGIDVHQFAHAALAAGATVYVKVESLRLWWSGRNWRGDTFYTYVKPPQIAQAEIAAKQPIPSGGWATR